MNTTPTANQIAKLSLLLGSCDSTVQFLNALAAVLGGEFEDETAASLVTEFAERFAVHEESTL